MYALEKGYINQKIANRFPQKQENEARKKSKPKDEGKI